MKLPRKCHNFDQQLAEAPKEEEMKTKQRQQICCFHIFQKVIFFLELNTEAVDL